MSERNIRLVRTSTDNHWAMFWANRYIFADISGKEPLFLKTPGGNYLATTYRPLAERILDDLENRGYEYHSIESILSWHFTMIDNFAPRDHAELERILTDCFIDARDWSLENNGNDEYWVSIFGEPESRKEELKRWLAACTHMQLTALCCIGNAYASINLAYTLARVMESSQGEKRGKQFKKLAEILEEKSDYGPSCFLERDFETFELYYGIHLEENGNIINDPIDLGMDMDDFVGKPVTIDVLKGRNYMHYTDGRLEQMLQEESVVLDFQLDTEEELEEEGLEDDDEEFDDEELLTDEGVDIDDELSERLEDGCWVKRISAMIDGEEDYYLLVIEEDEGHISSIRLLTQEVVRTGAGFFFVPGMELPGTNYYDEIYYLPEIVEKELQKLCCGRTIPFGFSLIGKTVPKALGDSIVIQSAHRQAYIEVYYKTENGRFKSFDYSTYQSTGSGYGDMFMRPQYLVGRVEEAVDAVLYILDKYSDEEYEQLLK